MFARSSTGYVSEPLAAITARTTERTIFATCPIASSRTGSRGLANLGRSEM
jgi:hypothetical protein